VPPYNDLSQRWLEEVGRITPKADPVDLSGIYQAIMRWIEKIAKKIFGADIHIPSPEEKTLLVVTTVILSAMVILFIIFLIRRFGSPINLFITRLKHPEKMRIRHEYENLFAKNDFAAAMRFLVRHIAETKSFLGRTFSELFHIRSNTAMMKLNELYGQSIHLGSRITKDDLEIFESSSSKAYPEVESIVKTNRKRKG